MKRQYATNEQLVETYAATVARMIINLTRWRRENRKAEVLMNWKYPKNVMMSCTLKHALELGLVQLNPAALKMLKAMSKDCEFPPTVNQIRVVIEFVHAVAAKKTKATRED